MQQEGLGLYAAQASFFLIISMVPLLMLLVTLLQFIFPVSKEEVLSIALTALPQNMESFAQGIVGDLFPAQTISIISVSTLILLWSASKGIHSVVKGIRHIYRMHEKPYYKERLNALGYTVIFILTILFALTVLVFGSSLWRLFLKHFPLLRGATLLVTTLKFLISTVLITLFFLLLYCRISPKEFSAPRVQLPGALFTTAGWILFSTGFSFYISVFANYSYIYGSLTAIILLMLWIYICMWLLFIGAFLNKKLLNRREQAFQMRIQDLH